MPEFVSEDADAAGKALRIAARVLERPRVVDEAQPAAKVSKEFKEEFFPVPVDDQRDRDTNAVRSLATRLSDLLAATNCLDQWCRIEPSEKNPVLARALTRWQEARKDDVTVQAIWRMEQSRRAARQGNLRAALAPHAITFRRIRAWVAHL